MKTIVLYDIHLGGHHLTYLKYFSQTLLKLDCRVAAFCPNPLDLYQWVDSHCPDHLDYFHAFEANEPASIRIPLIKRPLQPVNTLKRWIDAASNIQSSLSRLNFSPDFVFFAWIDDYLSHYLTHQIVDLAFPYPWAGIYFQPCKIERGQFLPVRNGIIGHYDVLKSSLCRAAVILNEDVAEKLNSKIHKPVLVFPDVTDESPPDVNFHLLRKIWDLSQGRTVIGLLGSLNRRKGLCTLLEVSQKLISEDFFFIFAGQFAENSFLPDELEWIQEVINSSPNNCLFFFESIPDGGAFNAVISECDILYAAYQNFPYSSNILTKAAIFQKPVIVSEPFCMSLRVKHYNLGLCIQDGDVEGCIQAIRQLSQQLEVDRFAGDFEGYKELHSIERLKTVFQELFEL